MHCIDERVCTVLMSVYALYCLFSNRGNIDKPRTAACMLSFFSHLMNSIAIFLILSSGQKKELLSIL